MTILQEIQAAQISPIFVVGAPRSGTTLTARILNRHPEIHAPGESHFFEDIWPRRHELGNLDAEDNLDRALDQVMSLYGRYNFPETQERVEEQIDRARLKTLVTENGADCATLYAAFMMSLADAAGATRFCDDTPKHLYYVSTLRALYPNARIVACVRDPRDFLCSYKNYWRRSTEGRRIKALYHPIITSYNWFATANLVAAEYARQEPSHFMLLSYEQLVRNPAEEVQRLCDFVDIPYSHHLVEVDSSNSSFASNRTGIFTDSVGRWQSELSQEEIWWVQSINGRHMKTFDHAPIETSPRFTTLALQAGMAPVALSRALHANRHKRGPLLKYLAKRISGIAQRR